MEGVIGIPSGNAENILVKKRGFMTSGPKGEVLGKNVPKVIFKNLKIKRNVTPRDRETRKRLSGVTKKDYASWISMNYAQFNTTNRTKYEHQMLAFKHQRAKRAEFEREQTAYFRSSALCKFCNNIYLGEVFKSELFAHFPESQEIYFCKCPYPIYGRKKTDFIDFGFLK